MDQNIEITQRAVAPDDVQVSMNNNAKVLHFSDGVEEEVDEAHVEQLEQAPAGESQVDASTLPWSSWFYHHISTAGTKTLSAVDYAGEGLANFFGITTPKYQLEIEEYERIQQEKKKMEEEHSGWSQVNKENQLPLVEEPSRTGNDMITPV